MIGRINQSTGLRATMLAVVIGATALAAPGAAFASSAPANDALAAATQIAYLPFEDTFVDNTAATRQASEDGAGCFDIGATVWYRITPSSSYAIRVRVAPVDAFDPMISVYEGTAPEDLNAISCVDSGVSGDTESAIVTLNAGQSYFIQIGGPRLGDKTGVFNVKVKRLPGPSNDNFGSAANLALGSIETGTTTSATMQAAESAPSCGPSMGRTVWFRYTPTTTRAVVANTVGSTFDTVLAAYTGSSLSSLSEVACNDDRGVDLMSKIEFTAVAGTTYYFQVGGYWGSGGELVLRLKTS